MSLPLISIIIPALKPDVFFHRAISSVHAAFFNYPCYEIICIVPSFKDFSNLYTGEILYFQDNKQGIYNAMNIGLNVATGEFLYFMGQDDILLPEISNAINIGINKSADLILADVYWGELGIFKNFNSKYSLINRNWCHQGVLYKRKLFLKYIDKYPIYFKVQADHFVNIKFSCNGKIKIYKHAFCVAWYSADGFSSSQSDALFRGIFPSLIRENFGYFFYLYVVMRRTALTLFRFFR